MCKAGGPRCPQTPGKKARRRFNDQVNKKVADSGKPVHDWKEKNVIEYDRLMRSTFDPNPDASVEEDTSWLNYRETGTQTSPSTSSSTTEYGGMSEDDYWEHSSFFASAGFTPYGSENTQDDDDDEEETDYSDMVSEDPNDVNAFLNQHFADEIKEAIEYSQTDKREWAPDPTSSVIPDEDTWDSWGDEGGVEDRSVDEVEDEWEVRDENPASTNAHLLPKEAIIHSPNPNPVFVYGTLRAGNGNYRNVLQGHTQKEQEGARLPGASMYTNGGFPYVMEEEDGGGVTGDLMYLDYDDFADTMQNLDWLEGTGDDIQDDKNHYNRLLRYVQTGDNEYVQAWVYMPPNVDRGRITSLRKVETGDWARRMERQ